MFEWEPRTWRLAAALALLLLIFLFNLSIEPALSPKPRQRVEAQGELLIAIQPYGKLSPLVLQQQVYDLKERFRAEVVVLPSRPLPSGVYFEVRAQADASALLDDLYIHRPANATHILGLTEVDLFARGWDYLYGFSQVSGRTAVVSLARLGAPRRGLLGGRGVAERVSKVALHELGHTFKLGHCRSRHCVMNTVDSGPELDRMSRFFCRRCLRRVNDQEVRAEARLARGDGLLRRGEEERALVYYLGEVLQRPTNAAIVNRLGVVSVSFGARVLGELAYRVAINLKPDFALPYYNIGLSLAGVAPDLSISFLQAGFRRDPERVEALGFMGSVYYDVFRDEHRALWYFQRYVREGGMRPEVLARYQRLTQPSIFEFEEGEVPIIRGDPDRGERLERELEALHQLLRSEDQIKATGEAGHQESR